MTWWSLLLAITPGAARRGCRVCPVPVSMLAAVVGVPVLVAGIAGAVLRTGLYFVPALVVVVGGLKLWRERS